MNTNLPAADASVRLRIENFVVRFMKKFEPGT
jgi:hypothetical protein